MTSVIHTPTANELAHLATPLTALPSLGWVAPNRCEPTLINPIKNIYSVKPLGGLWLSPLNNTQCTKWGNWLKREKWFLDEDPASFVHQTISLIQDSRILTISSWGDFQEILSKYLLLHPDFEERLEWDLPSEFIDFEQMAEDWDGLYLTARGQASTRFGPGGLLMNTPNLYGWDLESLLLFTPKVIKKVGEPKIVSLIK